MHLVEKMIGVRLKMQQKSQMNVIYGMIYLIYKHFNININDKNE
ncbi:hypothetical protein P3TCK_16904 [Photobacterium profundum 3TCK]|uniref:Uncharacterized protein n=1 Tax=Photobacterium profundum 3TCK TaxID=314280 RepID=Q1Z0Y1_9GAMM|nr:hypothetical protein P3TCK_16904 [Photobacterium profundum 3TCK]